MSALPFELPGSFLAHAARDAQWAAWVAGVPTITAALLGEWGLTVDGPPVHGHTALVVPVHAEGRRCVLKVCWPNGECRHEILALQHWHGQGAARMWRADPRRNGMLLERLGPRDLGGVDAVEACELIAGLYARLHVPAPPQLTTLASRISGWTDDLRALPRSGPMPHRIVEQAIHLADDLVADTAPCRILHGDLHYGNVLTSPRGWLAIDPQPLSGDPHYEIAPLLSDRWDEVVASGDVRSAVRRRFHAVVDTAGFDEDRARDWVIVREAHNAMWAVEDDEPDRVTTAIAVIKAVQD